MKDGDDDHFPQFRYTSWTLLSIEFVVHFVRGLSIYRSGRRRIAFHRYDFGSTWGRRSGSDITICYTSAYKILA